MNVVTRMFPKADIATRAGRLRFALSLPENTYKLLDKYLSEYFWVPTFMMKRVDRLLFFFDISCSAVTTVNWGPYQ